ncbi:MAG: hypothetical protein ABIN24_09155 [Dyadobacter sp.]
MVIESEKYSYRMTRYPDFRMETVHIENQVPFHSFVAKTYYISNFKDFNTLTPNLL